MNRVELTPKKTQVHGTNCKQTGIELTEQPRKTRVEINCMQANRVEQTL